MLNQFFSIDGLELKSKNLEIRLQKAITVENIINGIIRYMVTHNYCSIIYNNMS